MALPTAPIVLTAPTEAVRAGSALHATRTTRSTIVDRARHDQRTWRSGLTAVAAAVAATRPQRSTASGRDYGERGAQRRLRGPRALQQAVDLLVKELEMDERAAMRIVKDIRTFVVAREGEDATGSRSMAWAKRLCRGLKMHEGLEPLLQKVGGVEQVLLDLEARSNKHGEVFRDITRQHQALRDGEAVDMEDYGKAAEYMAQEWWVRASAERIIDRIDQYFLLSGEQVRKGHPPWAYSNDKNSVPKGWKQYEVQGRRLFWNPETMRMQTKAPPGYDADEPPREPPAAREPPLKLLDIGSSVNRFQDWPFFVEAHALDLQPQAEEVLQADFFEVPILEDPDLGLELSHAVRCDDLNAAAGVAQKLVVFGKNSDRPRREPQSVRRYERQRHEPGSVLKCTYIEIPQVPETHAVLLSQIDWMWGAEMGANERGVVCGNEAVWTVEDDSGPAALLGMDLLRLGLERGATAREALQVITSLLEQHGQGGACAEGDPSFTYHNSFLISDAWESWILETAGRQWVAQRWTEGSRNISNGLTIGSNFDLMSDGLLEHARERKLWDGSGDFHWARAFSSGGIDLSPHSRQACGGQLMQQHAKRCTLDGPAMMAILRDHDGGICMHGAFETTSAMVSELRRPADAADNRAQLAVATHWFTGKPHPCKCEFIEQSF
ncbi:unnamed protein product [Durusdinium trenchii]|uniref:Uncharacterized protein n=1 Tax=Durusdinium trenchii TaxID=1381693 RepID=A0ABP0KE13_9DINO